MTMDRTISFPTGRTRPKRFTNHRCCYTDEEMSDILAMEDTALRWHEYLAIFCMGGCSSSLKQREYFLPQALEFLRANGPKSFSLTANMTYFISSNSTELEHDGLLRPALDGLRACFYTWTEEFRVEHFDLAACRAKQWTLSHQDVVNNSEDVRDLINSMLEYEAPGPLAEELLHTWLAPSRSATQAAWFLEYARAERDHFDFDNESQCSDDTCKLAQGYVNEAVRRIITDRHLLLAATEIVKAELMPSEASPTYWPDTLRFLEL